MMSDQAGSPPAGWYNDPTAANQQRWWDGAQWSTSTRPLLDGQPPVMPPPVTTPMPNPFSGTNPADVPQQQPVVNQPKRGPTKIILLGLGLLLLFGGCVAVLGSSQDGEGLVMPETRADEAADESAALATEADEDTESIEDEAVEDTDTDSDSDIGDDATDGAFGTRDAPLPYDQPADLTWTTFGDADGSIWTTVIGRPRDITDEILAENEFNDPPPDGVRFVGFEAELTLVEAGKEPLSPGFNFSWEILGGSTARVYDSFTIDTDSFGCGVTGEQFDDFGEVFAGGTLTGTVCIPIPTEDLDHPETRVALHFSDDNRAIFGP